METGATHDREDPRVQCHRCLTFRYYDTITRGAHPCIPTQGWKILEDRVAELERENSVIRGEAAMEVDRLRTALEKVATHEFPPNWNDSLKLEYVQIIAREAILTPDCL